MLLNTQEETGFKCVVYLGIRFQIKTIYARPIYYLTNASHLPRITHACRHQHMGHYWNLYHELPSTW
jgi:hypothetical protein